LEKPPNAIKKFRLHTSSILMIILLNVLIFMIMYKESFFQLNEVLLISESDTFTGYFYWLTSIFSDFTFISNGNLVNTGIAYPDGEIVFNQYDIFYSFPKLFGIIFSYFFNPVVAVNLWIILGFVFTSIFTYKYFEQNFSVGKLNIVISLMFTYMPYFIFKSTTHSNYIHIWWLPLSLWIYQNKKINRYLFLVPILLSITIDPYFLLYHPFIFIFLLLSNNSLILNFKYLSKIVLIYLVTLLSFFFCVKYFPFSKLDSISRSVEDVSGFSFSLNDLLKTFSILSSYRNLPFVTSATNDENGLIPPLGIAYLFLVSLIIFIFTLIIGFLNKKILPKRIHFIHLFMILLIIISISTFSFDFLTIEIKSLNLLLLDIIPVFRSFTRIYPLLIFFVTLFILGILEKSKVHKVIVFFLVPLLLFDLTVLRENKINFLNMNSSEFITVNKNISKSDVLYFLPINSNISYVGWQYVYQKRIANGFIPLMGNPIGIGDPNSSCIYSSLGIDVVAVNKQLVQSEIFSGLKYADWNKDDFDYSYFKVTSKNRYSYLSKFDSGFWPIELSSQSGAWTKSSISVISIGALGKSDISSKTIELKFFIASLETQDVQITTPTQMFNYTVDELGQIITLEIRPMDKIVIKTSRFFRPSDSNFKTEDRRLLGIFVSRPSTSSC
jgi:hypothetical protein